MYDLFVSHADRLKYGLIFETIKPDCWLSVAIEHINIGNRYKCPCDKINIIVYIFHISYFFITFAPNFVRITIVQYNR